MGGNLTWGSILPNRIESFAQFKDARRVLTSFNIESPVLVGNTALPFNDLDLIAPTKLNKAEMCAQLASNPAVIFSKRTTAGVSALVRGDLGVYQFDFIVLVNPTEDALQFSKWSRSSTDPRFKGVFHKLLIRALTGLRIENGVNTLAFSVVTGLRRKSTNEVIINPVVIMNEIFEEIGIDLVVTKIPHIGSFTALILRIKKPIVEAGLDTRLIECFEDLLFGSRARKISTDESADNKKKTAALEFLKTALRRAKSE